MDTAEMKKLAAQYMPVLYFDKKEPFPLLKIGFSVYEENQQSVSAPYQIRKEKYQADFCIEYAFYYDYDIQHLYDLEHVWLYVNSRGEICGCVSSFHGMYLNPMLQEVDLFHGTEKVHLYVQPGKHAFMPAPELFRMFVDYDECCGKLAGKDGILCPDIIPGMPDYTQEENDRVLEYIRENYSFVPSEEYQPKEFGEEILCPWKELCEEIPGRIEKEIKRITL